jgi:hemolysin activation/secretion protein
MYAIKQFKHSMVLKIKNRIIFCCVMASMLSLFFASTAYAQNSSETTTPSEAPREEPSKRPAPKFNIWEYKVYGINLIAPETIENLLTPFLGSEKDFSTVELAAQALEKLYRDSGFPVVVVDIPEQDVVGGKVRLNVTEGVISRVKVTGSDYFLLSDIKERVPSIQEGGSLYVPKLQQELNKLNSLSSDLRVVPVLKEGDEPGSVQVELKVKDQLPLHGEIQYNNYASANTSATRLSGSIGYENLWNKFHNFSLNMQITPEALEEIKVLSGTYVLPIEAGTSRLAIYGVSSKSQIDTVTEINGIRVLGESKIGGLRYVKPMNYSPEFQHVVTLGFDYKDVLELVTVQNNSLLDAENRFITPIKFALWTAEYKATWRKEKSTTQLGGGVYFGLRNVFNSDEEFSTKRFSAEPNFIYWKAFVQRNDQLPADFTLINKIKFQFTELPLISNEQLSIGGFTSVRGYFESQNIGDKGVIATIELYTPKLGKDSKTLSDLKFFTFLDGGSVEVLNPLPDQNNHFDLASAGLGIEFSILKDIKAELIWSYPLRDSCGGLCGTSVSDIEKGESHTGFDLTYTF